LANANNYVVTLQFTRSGSGWTGSMILSISSEPLTDIAFDPRTGGISFVRPKANQHYTGTLSGDRMSGRFDNTYNWTATRIGAAPTSTVPITPPVPPAPSANSGGAPKLANGYAVDNCLHWGSQCGKPAADEYCRLTGHPGGAVSFATANMHPTWVIGDNRACTEAFCVGFTSIQCSSGSSKPQTSPSTSLTGAWVHSADPRTQVPDSLVIIVQDGSSVNLTQTYKTSGKWVTLACRGVLSGLDLPMLCNWVPGGNPFGFAGNWKWEMKVSADGNHIDGADPKSGHEAHYSRRP
jgi:hypothetical protein